MNKKISTYRCQNCNFYYAKWAGKCNECGAWGSVEKDDGSIKPPKNNMFAKRKGEIILFKKNVSKKELSFRKRTGLKEFDRVLGGGLVNSSAILLSGDPGIGKSTLLLQVANSFSQNGANVIYISGEEAEEQIRMRAERLDHKNSNIKIGSETDLNNILATLETEKFDLLIIDSIQTINSDLIDSMPGSVAQVKNCVLELTKVAKSKGFSIIFVGHVTKDGQIAGPKLVEHMVDTVIHFENDNGIDFRILRTLKNRFGASNEIGVFEMTSKGLEEVENPSQLFISERDQVHNGSTIFGALEGSRPVLVEIQTLVAKSSLATPRRTVVGLDSTRLSMILAILDARCSINLSTHDVFLNVAGGIRISEPAADLAVAFE